MADAEVFISVIDSAQRPPIFEQSRYSYSVREDAKKDSFVGSVKATVLDSGKCLFFIFQLQQNKVANWTVHLDLSFELRIAGIHWTVGKSSITTV